MRSRKLLYSEFATGVIALFVCRLQPNTVEMLFMVAVLYDLMSLSYFNAKTDFWSNVFID